MRSTENHRSPSIRWSDGFRFRQTNTSTALLLPLTCLDNKWPPKQIHTSRIHNLIWRCKEKCTHVHLVIIRASVSPWVYDVLTMAADGHVLGFDQVKTPALSGSSMSWQSRQSLPINLSHLCDHIICTMIVLFKAQLVRTWHHILTGYHCSLSALELESWALKGPNMCITPCHSVSFLSFSKI